MKKLFTSLLLLAAGVFISSAYAEGTVSVLGKSISSGSGSWTKSSNSAITNSGKVSYQFDSSGNLTLTFEDVTIDYSSVAVNFTLDKRLTINCKGTVSIKCADNCIWFHGKGDRLYITGEGEESSKLTLTTTKYAPLSFSPTATSEAYFMDINVSINRPTTDYNGIYGSSDGTLYFHNSHVYISKGDKPTIGGLANVKMSTAVYNSPSDVTYSTSKKELQKDGSTYTGALTVMPSLVVNGIYVSLNSDATAGSGWKYTRSDKTLTINGAISAGSNEVVGNYGCNGLIVNTTSAATVTSSTNCFALYQPTTFKGSSKLTVKAGSSATGIFPMSSTATLTFDACNLDVSGKYGIDGSGGQEAAVTFKNANVKVNGTTATMGRIKSITFNGCDIATTGVRFVTNGLKKGSETDYYAGAVEIKKVTTTYSVKVCGKAFNDVNVNNFYVDGLTAGTVTWDNSSSTLTLNGVTLNETNDINAIEINTTSATTVKVVGDNEITSKGRGIYFAANTTISGTGNVIFTSTAGSGGAAQTGKNLTLNTNGRVSFFGETYGLWVGSGLTMKKTNANTHFRFKGKSNGSLYVSGTLSLDGVALWSGWSADADAMFGCYFDNQFVRQNGGAVAKGLVAFKYVEEKYNLYVAGTQVTDCNAPGLGSKYIKAGGAKAVTYNATSNTLTLNGATIDNGGATVNCINDKGMTGNFTIKVASASKLISDASGNACIYFESQDAPATITGNGKLTFGGAATNGIVSYPNLTLDNVEIEMSNSLKGSNAYKNLTVKLTTAGRRVTVKGTVCYWGDVLCSGGTKIINPDPWKMYDHSVWNTNLNAIASPVVFGDSSATGIEGIVADPNAEVIGIFDAQGRQLDDMQPGINILRMSDGTTRKVIKK